MKVLINGQPKVLDPGCTVLALLQAKGLQDKRVAVEVNEEVLSRSEHATYQLQAQDRVEIVHAIGGG
ncbi:sulfur carrier protein ThiS [Thiopseudomonas alkaliphila]|uniref:sulfur carrier protein ThiS n=1 Tax=Thiopseudomonas alkaliphila TaxID=1697053 RepID=UPI0006A00199|nr:sulfur carrier protein ThiS [Thiopseudomonas alkaliphila]AKX53432.1 thiamine biosynthesis protein ThiS [Thiopseudomonas alkaliphila]